MANCLPDIIDDPDNTWPFGWIQYMKITGTGGCAVMLDSGPPPPPYNNRNEWIPYNRGPAGTKPGDKSKIPPKPPIPNPDDPPGPDPGPVQCPKQPTQCGDNVRAAVVYDDIPDGATRFTGGIYHYSDLDRIIAVRSDDEGISPCPWGVAPASTQGGTLGFSWLADGLAGMGGWCGNVTGPKGTFPYVMPEGSNPPPAEECCPPDTRPALMAIKGAIDELTEKIGSEAMDCAKIADKCIDEITDAVIKKLKATTKTCKQCCQEISDGVSHNAAEALVCAACECEDCHRTCSLGDPENEGKCCDTCGEEKCICQGEECVPAPIEEPPPGQYYAWCNPTNGNSMVRQNTSEQPAPGYVLVGTADTQSGAQSYLEGCGQLGGGSGGQFPQSYPQPPINSSWPCNLDFWTSPSGAQSVLSSGYGEAAIAFLANEVIVQVTASAETLSQVPLIGPQLAASATSYVSGMRMVPIFAPILAGLAGCDTSPFIGGMMQLATFGLAQQITGVSMNEFTTPIRYAMNKQCRQVMLDPDKAISCWLADSCDDEDLDTFWAIAGYCPDSLAKYKIAAQSKLLPNDLSILLRRGDITLADYRFRMGQLGYKQADWIDQAFSLSEQRPPYSDIIRMMVRDADDQSLVDKFGMDDNFTDKYQSQLKQWAKDQGVPDQVMKYLWRSHWSIPAPGQLYEMYHRLRNDPRFGGPDAFLSDVKSALIQQDILPYWIDKFLAISFRPIGRVDVRRAYNIGAMDDARVLRAYQDLGYSDADAETMLAFSRTLRNQAAISNRSIKLWQKYSISGTECKERMVSDGIPQDVASEAMRLASIGFETSWPVKAFVAGEMSAPDLTQELVSWGVDPSIVERIVHKKAGSVTYHPAAAMFAAGTKTSADARQEMIAYGISQGRVDKLLQKTIVALSARSTAACVDAIQTRYMLGEISRAETVDELKSRGLTDERISLLLSQWDCESTAVSRQVQSSTLCNWLAQGVLTPTDFIDRLDRMGYTRNDAIQMLVDCQGSNNAKQVKEALAKAKADASELEKQQRKAQKAEAQIQRQQQQIQRAQKAAQAARSRRSRQSASAAEKLYLASGQPLPDVTDKVNSAYSRILSQYGLSPDEALQALLQASESFSSDSLSDYDGLANTYAQMIVDRALTPDEIPPG